MADRGARETGAGDRATGAGAELDALETEGRLPAAAGLDQLPTRGQVALMAARERVAAAAVDAAGGQVAAAVDAIVARLRGGGHAGGGGRVAGGGRLLYVGAGTPGRLAVLDAAECPPTFGVAPDRVVALVAGGTAASTSAVESAEDDAQAGSRDLLALDVGAADAVVGISASGRTPYVLAALAAARAAGALTVAVVNNPGSPLAAAADLAVELRTGPEVIAGSTRLAAGSAQKAVLNALSTLTMVALGHTYGDLMIDVRASNAKLRRRAERSVALATGAGPHEVAAALHAADGAAKVAVVALLAGIDAAEARRRLDAAGGHVRAAVAAGRGAVDAGSGTAGTP